MEPENAGLEISKSFAEAVGTESVRSVAGLFSSLFPFFGLKKKSIDAYIHEIEQSDMSPEAKMYAIANAKKTFRELKNQSAIIEVACSTLSLEQGADLSALPSPPDDELLSRLIDAGKFVSDEDLQLLWGNVLAGELEHPGDTPKSVVRVLSELSKENALIFSDLTSLEVDLFADTGEKLVFIDSEIMAVQIDAPYLKRMEINFEKLRELEHLNLINFASIGTYTKPIPSSVYPYIHIASDNEVITVYNKSGEFSCGVVLLTPVGKCISRFVKRRHSQEHMDAIKDGLKETGLVISPTPGISVQKVQEKSGTDMEYNWQRLWTEPPQT